MQSSNNKVEGKEDSGAGPTHTTEKNNEALQHGVQIRALARHQRCSDKGVS